jgi:hypothetical protein
LKALPVNVKWSLRSGHFFYQKIAEAADCKLAEINQYCSIILAPSSITVLVFFFQLYKTTVLSVSRTNRSVAVLYFGC